MLALALTLSVPDAVGVAAMVPPAMFRLFESVSRAGVPPGLVPANVMSL
jgi:hypothetical protein